MKNALKAALFTMLLPATLHGQEGAESLSSVMHRLPSVVRSNGFTMEKWGKFADELDLSIKEHPTDVSEAIPFCRLYLHSPDPAMRFYTMAVVSGLALTPDGAQLLTPLSSDIANAIVTDEDRTKALAILTIDYLGSSAPTSIISPLIHLLRSRHDSERLTLGSAETLMIVQPSNEDAQNAVVEALNDLTLPRDVRIKMVLTTAREGAGKIFTDNLIQMLSQSKDDELQDASVRAAGKLGPDAVARMKVALTQVTNDPTSSTVVQNDAKGILSLNP